MAGTAPNRARWLLALLATLMVAACGGAGGNDLDALDEKLGGKADVDPAMTRALEDQIMVDPELVGQSNRDAIRPPNEAFGAAVPPGEGNAGPQPAGQVAARLAGQAARQFENCSLKVSYTMRWSTRLPADLPLPANARVGEAAGSDQGACGLRAITYSSASAPRALADYYTRLASKGGYQATSATEGRGTMISAWRDRDGAAFYAIIQPQPGGAMVDLVANRGI